MKGNTFLRKINRSMNELVVWLMNDFLILLVLLVFDFTHTIIQP